MTRHELQTTVNMIAGKCPDSAGMDNPTANCDGMGTENCAKCWATALLQARPETLDRIARRLTAEALQEATDNLLQDQARQLVRPSDTEFLALRARKNLTKWGVQDFETLGLAIAEECGELCQAILQAKHEGGERGRISQEAIDLGALCIQVLVSMRERHGKANLLKALGVDGPLYARNRPPRRGAHSQKMAM